MNDDEMKYISNLKISKESYKYFKKISIDKEVPLQKVLSEILEKFATKKNKNGETIE